MNFRKDLWAYTNFFLANAHRKDKIIEISQYTGDDGHIEEKRVPLPIL